MSFWIGSEDFKLVREAVNQGIDAHLEAIQFTGTFDSDHQRYFMDVEEESVPVLCRRLREMPGEYAGNLADDIEEVWKEEDA